MSSVHLGSCIPTILTEIIFRLFDGTPRYHVLAVGEYWLRPLLRLNPDYLLSFMPFEYFWMFIHFCIVLAWVNGHRLKDALLNNGRPKMISYSMTSSGTVHIFPSTLALHSKQYFVWKHTPAGQFNFIQLGVPFVSFNSGFKCF